MLLYRCGLFFSSSFCLSHRVTSSPSQFVFSDVFLSSSSATHIQCTHENKEKGNEVSTESTLCLCQVEERSSWRQKPAVLPYPFPSINLSFSLCNVICICITGCL